MSKEIANRLMAFAKANDGQIVRNGAPISPIGSQEAFEADVHAALFGEEPFNPSLDNKDFPMKLSFAPQHQAEIASLTTYINSVTQGRFSQKIQNGEVVFEIPEPK